LTQDRKLRAGVLALLCSAYVLAFAPANLTGADDVNMLGVFALDEFGQFGKLWKMTSPAPSAAEALYRFIAYDYYWYGFPFFALSAAVFWPLRAIYLAAAEPGLTTAAALVLRELSPLFTALAIAILVALWTRLRSLPQMLATFAFLAALPAVVENNLWWHPDAMLLFLMVCAIAGLSLDRSRLGPWFYAAALACGLATATKSMGLWFFAAVALHLLRARSQHRLPQLALAGAGFAFAMTLAILAASPHFFLPSEWEEIAAALLSLQRDTHVGWFTKGQIGIAPWVAKLRSGFGWATLWLALTALCVATARRAHRVEHRDLAATLLAWLVPISAYFVAHVGMQHERYLLPMLVPLASCVGSPLLWDRLAGRGGQRAPRLLAIAFVAALCLQWGFHLQEDARRYHAVLHREDGHPALAFWQRVESELLADLPTDSGAHLRVFRDQYLYVPPSRQLEVHIRWHSTSHADIAEARPDLILLKRSNLDHFAAPDAVARSTDVEQAERASRFYRDAEADAIPGYRLLLETDFALAYGRTGLQLGRSQRAPLRVARP